MVGAGVRARRRRVVHGHLLPAGCGRAFAIGGVAAWLGGSTPIQLLIGGVLAVLGTVAAHQWRKRHATPAPQTGLDVGQEVQVLAWNDNGTARVNYRGTQWDAAVASSHRQARADHVHRRHARLDAGHSRPAGPDHRRHGKVKLMKELGDITMLSGSYLVGLAFFVVAVIVVVQAFRVVPQQHAWVVERLGRFYAVLQPGLNLIIPIVDRVAYRHDLREIPLDVPSQICITRDNTQLQVDGILYFQVTDPKLASYGSSNYVLAITQLAQTTLRSIIGRMEARQDVRGTRANQRPGRQFAGPGGGELGRQASPL
jgi:membrane protein implicated in regulation of membrane protease activity